MAWEGSRGEGRNWQPPGWAKLRKAVFERDGHRCVKCGSEGPLECDHIDGNTNHDLSNLQALCVPCHRRKTASEAGRARAAKYSRKRRPEKHPGLI